MEKLDIKPCPFCGGEATVEFSSYANKPEKGTFVYVQCTKCYARGRMILEKKERNEILRNTLCEPAIDAAIAYWNNRVPLPVDE